MGPETNSSVAGAHFSIDDRHIIEPYKLAVANIRVFFVGLKNMLDPIDRALIASGSRQSPRMEQIAEELYAAIYPRMKGLFGAFEAAALKVPAELVLAHRAYAQRELHPYMLCAPLVNRSFNKPLGYAGDYEMVNMLLRNGMEGPSIYAWIVNAYFLRMDVAEGHRNRITKLVDMLQERAQTQRPEDRPLLVLNVGCGPADEVTRFIRRDPICEHCQFTLLDFNRQTLDYAKERIDAAAIESGRRVQASYVHKSVNDLLKEASRGARLTVQNRSPSVGGGYDVVYCAGLFDYLSDRVCSHLLRLFASWTLPGGLVVATNVHPNHSAHATLDDLAEWHLILRSEADMLALAPHDAGSAHAETEPAGANVFLEIRLPSLGTDDGRIQNGRDAGAELRGQVQGPPRRGL